MIESLESILGLPPAGLEALEYVFAAIFLFVGVYIVYKTITLFFSKFN